MGVRVAENLYGKYGVPSLDLVFTSPRAGLKNVAGDTSLEVEFSRTQDTQASYVKSDGTIGYASTDVARFDHDPTTGESLGLLIEESRTNLQFSSSDYTTNYWDFSFGITKTPNATTAPDGTLTATLIQQDTTDTIHALGGGYGFNSGYITLNTTYTLSLYVKYYNSNKIRFMEQYTYANSTTGSYTKAGVIFNFETESIEKTIQWSNSTQSLIAGYKVDKLPDGWYRLNLSVIPGSDTNNQRVYFGVYPQEGNLSGVAPIPSGAVGIDGANYSSLTSVTNFVGDGSTGVYIWGAQVEAGSFPTSYIPTTPTFTSRASNATYYDVNGNVAFAATDVAREPAYFPDSDGTMIPAGLLLEGEETNDNQYSEYHTQYSTTAAEVIENQALAPDLSWTASSLVETTDTDYHELLPYPTPSIGSTTRLTFSTFIKNKQGSKNALLRFNDGVDDVGMYFNPSSGSVVGVLTGAGTTTPSDYGSQKLNNDWYRIYVTADATVGTRETAIHIIDNTTYSTHTGTAGTDGFYLWGVQMEQSPFMSSYIESPASFTSRSQTNAESASFYQSNGIIGYAATDVARDDAYFPDENGVFYPAGLLLEDQATNLMTYSEDFNNWNTKTNITVSTATTETNAPDGTQTADKITNTANETGLSNTISSVTGTHTASIYVKYAGTTNWARIATGTGNPQVWFDINNGTVGTENNGAVGQIQSVSNGWYRCSITADFSGVSFVGISPSTADGSTTEGNGNSLYVWGTQVEEGSYATSYIPTAAGISTRGADFSSSSATTRAADISSSSTSTRGADMASITGAGFNSFYNQSEGTWLTEFANDPTKQGSFQGVLSVGPNNTPRIEGDIVVGYGGFTAFTPTDLTKAAVAYGSTEGRAINGSVQSGSGGTLDTETSVVIGTGAASAPATYILSTTIKRLTYWPRRLPDSDLQSLTE